MGEEEALKSLRERRDIDRAFAALVEPNKAAVHSFLLRRCRNRADADELLQQTLISAYNCIGKFDRRRGTFNGWLKGIAENRWLEMCRDRYRGERAAVALADGSPVSCAGPDAAMVRQVREEAVWRMLSRLDPIDALVAVMHWMKRMTHEEIGRELNMPAGTVKQHALRAEHLLRAQLLVAPLPRASETA